MNTLLNVIYLIIKYIASLTLSLDLYPYPPIFLSFYLFCLLFLIVLFTHLPTYLLTT